MIAAETAYSESRFVVLLGPSGCGKTVIAKLWAEGKLQAHKVFLYDWSVRLYDKHVELHALRYVLSKEVMLN